jgi:hypothetical protein
VKVNVCVCVDGIKRECVPSLVGSDESYRDNNKRRLLEYDERDDKETNTDMAKWLLLSSLFE